MARYYIAPTTGGPGGSAAGAAGNSGTFSSPWDLRTAFNGGNPPGTVQPDDTLILRKGTYIGLYEQNNSGTAGHPVTITNYAPDLVNWPQDLPTIDSHFEVTLTQSMANTASNTNVTVTDVSNLFSGLTVYIYRAGSNYTELGEVCRVSGAPTGLSVLLVRKLSGSPSMTHAVGDIMGIHDAAGYIEAGKDVVVKNIRCTTTKPIRAVDYRRCTYDFGTTFLATPQDFPYERMAAFDIGSANSTAGTRSVYTGLVADNGSAGMNWWTNAVDSLISHILIANGGYDSTDRGHGHGLYSEGVTGIHTGDGIVGCGQFGTQFKVFGANQSMSGFHYNNCIFVGSAPQTNAKLVDQRNISPGAGTVSFNGTTTVTFNAGAVTTTLLAGDDISPDGGVTWKSIASITDSTHLELTSASGVPTATIDDCLVGPGWNTSPGITVFWGTNNIAPRATDLKMDRGAVYAFPLAGAPSQFGQDTSNPVDLTLTNNVFDSYGLSINAFDTLTITGNTIVQRGTNPLLTANKIRFDTSPPEVPISVNWDNNTYYYEASSANPFTSPGLPGSSGQKTLAQWRTEWANAGYTVDANSTAPGAPTGTKVLVTNDPFERGRCNAAIFNWSGASTVNVTPPNLWLRPGDAYRVYAAESFDQGPTQTGVYNGASIPITMAATTTSAPFDYKDSAGNPIRVTTTRPTFGAFIVMRAPG